MTFSDWAYGHCRPLSPPIYRFAGRRFLVQQVFGPTNSCVSFPCVFFFVIRRNLSFGRWVLALGTCNTYIAVYHLRMVFSAQQQQ